MTYRHPCSDYDGLVDVFGGDSGCDLLNPVDGYPRACSKLESLRTCFVENGPTASERMGVFVDVFPVDGFLPRAGKTSSISWSRKAARLSACPRRRRSRPSNKERSEE